MGSAWPSENRESEKIDIPEALSDRLEIGRRHRESKDDRRLRSLSDQSPEGCLSCSCECSIDVDAPRMSEFDKMRMEKLWCLYLLDQVEGKATLAGLGEEVVEW